MNVATKTTAASLAAELERRLKALDWDGAGRSLDERGYTTIPALLTPAQ